MAMFPKGGTNDKVSILPGETEISTGNGPGPIDIPILDYVPQGLVEPLADVGKFVDKYLGWLKPFREPRPARRPDRPPVGEGQQGGGAQGYSADFEIGSGNGSYENAYARIADDIRRRGYRLIELPEGEMVCRFGDSDGYEMGRDVYVNKERRGMHGLKVRAHEGFTKYLAEMTGMKHYSLHDVVRPLETPMAMAYVNGERNVFDRFAERAMRELRMAA